MKIFFAILLIFTSIYFGYSTLDSSVSKKYEIFEPTETYYYSTLKTEKEKVKYVNEINKNNQKVNFRLYLNFILTILSFSGAFYLIFKKKKNVA